MQINIRCPKCSRECELIELFFKEKLIILKIIRCKGCDYLKQEITQVH